MIKSETPFLEHYDMMGMSDQTMHCELGNSLAEEAIHE